MLCSGMGLQRNSGSLDSAQSASLRMTVSCFWLSVSRHIAFGPHLLRDCHGDNAVIVGTNGGRRGAVGLADEGFAFFQQSRAVEQAWLGGKLSCEIGQHVPAIGGGG